MQNCRFSFLDTGIPQLGRLELLSTERGLFSVLFCDERRSRAAASWRRREVGAVVPAAPGEHDGYARELVEFFAGERCSFGSPLHLAGTPFQRAVWNAVRAVPYGSVATYGEIARAVGSPGASRAVGAANGANPLPFIIPCHRIVGASGLTGYGGGLDAKRWLLARENARSLALAS